MSRINYQQLSHQRDQLGRDAKRISDFIGMDEAFLALDSVEQELLKEQCESMWHLYEVMEKRIKRHQETSAAQSAEGE